MLKCVHSQLTNAINKLQVILALTLFSHVDDHESLLSDRIDILMSASKRLFDRSQNNITIDKKIVNRTLYSSVSVVDEINDISRLLRNKFIDVNVCADVVIANVNRHSFIDNFRVLSQFSLSSNELASQSFEVVIFNRDELEHVAVIVVNRHDRIVRKIDRDFRHHLSHHRQWQLFEKARHLDTMLMIIAKIAYHWEKEYLKRFEKLIFDLQYRKQ